MKTITMTPAEFETMKLIDSKKEGFKLEGQPSYTVRTATSRKRVIFDETSNTAYIETN